MNNPAPIRLVVTDVDGTLVRHDKTLAPSTVEAARALRRHGIKLGLVSSRPAHGLDVLLAPLEIDTPRAGFNGAEVLGPDDALLSELTIDPGVAREAIRAMTEAGVDSWVFADGKWYLTNPRAHYIPREELSIKMDYTRVDDLTPYLGRVHKIMGSHTDVAVMARMEAELAASLAGRAAVLRSQSYYLDITHPQANKGFAAQSLARLLGVDDAHMACIGDMPNDTPMFSVCGLAIAMGNAPESVKALAMEVTGSNEEDGWAEAIDRFVLPRAPAA